MLDRVPGDVRKIGFARALVAAAVPVFNALERWTPVAEYPAGMFAYPGSLSLHIRTDIYFAEDGGVASINFGKYGDVARFVEYGHRMIAHGAKWADRMKNYVGKVLGIVPPHPFMRPAAFESADDAVEAFVRSLEETLVTGTSWASVAAEFDKVA
jgi:hypothetical protein